MSLPAGLTPARLGAVVAVVAVTAVAAWAVWPHPDTLIAMNELAGHYFEADRRNEALKLGINVFCDRLHRYIRDLLDFSLNLTLIIQRSKVQGRPFLATPPDGVHR